MFECRKSVAIVNDDNITWSIINNNDVGSGTITIVDDDNITTGAAGTADAVDDSNEDDETDDGANNTTGASRMCSVNNSRSTASSEND